MTYHKKILIVDMTHQTLFPHEKVADVMTLSRDAKPDLFKPYELLIFTALVRDLPEDLVYVKDYINASGYNPLVGRNRDDLGPRFPDMSFVFSPPVSQKLPSVIVTAGDIDKPNTIRCDPLVWNAILGSHQKKKILGLLYRDRTQAEALIKEELKALKR
ncbi:MAG: hypothetical protein PWP06_265 [Candidatus Marinimicrobia bacterium]|jgi:hypothetical protein|nr:hypothetical protein [Candidatus Neomarinimicrobiota bacterium]